MAHGYFVSRISENLGINPATGYLVAKDAVIARTGFQSYRGSELPGDELKSLDFAVPDDKTVEVYRPAEEVFSKSFLSSLEGMPVTDGHPSKFLAIDDSPDTFRVSDYQKGHIQNVRKGDEPLDSGDWPIIADLIITDKDLIQKIENGLRELSCGYGFHLSKDDSGRLLQVGMTGNHVAVVPRGRAGPEARINDAAAEEIPTPAVAQPETPQPTTETSASATRVALRPKERKMAVKIDWKHIFGLGLKEYAKDAEPGDITEAVSEIEKLAKREESGVKEPEEPGQKLAGFDARHAKDREEAEDRRHAKDAGGKDHKSRMRRAFERALDEVDKREDEREASDADMEELKKLMSDFLSEEEEEPEHADDKRRKRAKDAKGEKEEEEKEEEEEAEDKRHAHDSEKEEEEEEEDREHKANDSEASEFVEPIGASAAKPAKGNDAVALLNGLRPFVAKSKDVKLRSWFNREAARANDSMRGKKAGTGGSYGEFREAASKPGKQAKDSLRDNGVNDDEALRKMQEFYDKQGKTINGRIN